MNLYAIILTAIAVVSVGCIYYALKTAERHDEEIDKVQQPKFQPRKVTYTKGVDPYETEKPKRKKKKYYNKKKKPAVAENAQVEKRPVGRPRKAE